MSPVVLTRQARAKGSVALLARSLVSALGSDKFLASLVSIYTAVLTAPALFDKTP